MKKTLLVVLAFTAAFVLADSFGGGSSGGGSVSLTPPVQANWTGFNTVGLTQGITYQSSRFEFATNAAVTDNLQGVQTALPSVPYTKIFRIWAFVNSKAFSRAGVGWSDGTKYVFCGAIQPNTAATLFSTGIDISNWTNVTTFSAGLTFPTGINGTLNFPNGVMWFRLIDDSTNWKCDVSYDGNNWLNVLTETRNTFLTATQLAVIADTGTSNQIVKVVFDSFL